MAVHFLLQRRRRRRRVVVCAVSRKTEPLRKFSLAPLIMKNAAFAFSSSFFEMGRFDADFLQRNI
jgi:hypothetical protein